MPARAHGPLGEKSFTLSAAFFILGGNLKDAIQVCLEARMDVNLQLTPQFKAMTVWFHIVLSIVWVRRNILDRREKDMLTTMARMGGCTPLHGSSFPGQVATARVLLECATIFAKG